MNKPERRELRWVLTWAVIVVLLSSLPYLWGMFITPHGYSFLGLTHNIDDGAVYLSWMRQAADGHFFVRNLFTNEAQPAMQFNVLFLVMGWFAALTHLPLIVVFHLFRIVLGVVLILGIWQFSKLFLDDPKQRRLLIPLVGLSAGIGWMIPGAAMPTGSVDVWQPEAITFLSIYLNPLFLAGLLLMIGSFYWLEIARREGKAKYAVLSGAHLLVLGNVHTYDVLTVACVWAAYIIVLCVTQKRLLWKTIGLTALAAAIALPSVAYQIYVYVTDPVYAARANTPIPSPPILSYFEGYGLVLAGAVVGAILLMRRARSGKRHSSLLIRVWAVVGFAVPYLPIAQQRKLVMGLHLPLCILCAYALSTILQAFRSMKTKEPGAMRGIWSPKAVELRILLLSILFWMFVVLSPANFLLMDVDLLSRARTVTHYSPFMSREEVQAMRFLRSHGKPDDVLYAPPNLSLFAPAMTGLAVHYGHWSETPDYAGKYSEWRAACVTGEADCASSFLDSGSTVLVTEGFSLPDTATPYFRLEYGHGAADEINIYRVRQPDRGR